MATSTTRTMDIFINDKGPFAGTLNVETEALDVTMGRDTYKPDPDWVYVCKGGHWHAFTSDGKLPTLERYEKPIPCAGWCGGACGGEGTSETRYRCRACGKRVRPGYVVDVPGGMRRVIPGRTSWTVTVSGRTMWTADASVRVVSGGRTAFGIATPRMVSADPDGFTYDFIGVTELGQRAS